MLVTFNAFSQCQKLAGVALCSNTTWTASTIDEDIIVSCNSTLTINTNILARQDVQITIEPGSTIKIDGGSISLDPFCLNPAPFSGQNSWSGIILQSSGGAGGRIIMQNGASLNDAQTSITATNDAKIDVTNSSFTNNFTSVRFTNKSNAGQFVFVDNNITWNRPYPFGFNFQQPQFYYSKGIVLDNCQYAVIKGLSISCTAAGPFDLNYRGTGISCFGNTNLNLYNSGTITNDNFSCPTFSGGRNSEFINISTGIDASLNANSQIQIHKADFTNNWYGCIIVGGTYHLIKNCTFDYKQSTANSTPHNTTSIAADFNQSPNNGKIDIVKNIFKGDAKTYGYLSLGTGSAAEVCYVAENTFTNTNTTPSSFSVGINVTGYYSMHCNTFTNLVKCWNVNGFLMDQGSPTKNPMNVFNGCDRVYSNYSFRYYYDKNSDLNTTLDPLLCSNGGFQTMQTNNGTEKVCSTFCCLYRNLILANSSCQQNPPLGDKDSDNGTDIDLKLYPNPVSNTLIISSTVATTDDTWVNIIDSRGFVKKHIKCNLIKDVGFEINTSGLENGLYYLVLTSSNITYKPLAFNIIK